MLAKKLMRAQSAEPTYVDDVFSTYLYEGNGSTQTITNGIDLAGEGGLVWGKVRSATGDHKLTDTERGTNSQLSSNTTSAEATSSSQLTSFNSDGFSVGSGAEMNGSGYDMVSWTFRKAPKFFDVVTYTGDGVAGRQIAHNLGATIGAILIKNLDVAESWVVYHVHIDSAGYLILNSTNGENLTPSIWDSTSPTDTHFTLGSDGKVNGSSNNYVAYLFAHNDGDGGFGASFDQDIIKCGSFTATTGDDVVTLGFEPQYLIAKKSDGSGNWIIIDSARGFNDLDTFELKANTSGAEETYGQSYWEPTATGFIQKGNFGAGEYIYIAIAAPI